MALLLIRKLGELTILHTQDGDIRIWVVDNPSRKDTYKLAIEAPASVAIERDDMKKGRV